MTRPWTTIDSESTSEGLLELRRRGERDFLIVIAGRVLMTSVARRSEEALATLAIEAMGPRKAPRVLVGGLGMGFTLRAALDALPATARVLVAELSRKVVDWCRGPLAPLTAGAVDDPRVTVELGDVARTITTARAGSFDAILLDLYEGPYAKTQRREDPFFGPRALARAHAALAPGGVLAVWSEEVDPTFASRLRDAGFTVRTHRPGRGGRAHVVYLASR